MLARINILASFVGIFWILEIVNVFFFRNSLDLYGIMPHQTLGLRGILFAPFLHSDFTHLIANTIPFLILGFLVMLQKINDFFVATFWSALVGGVGVWLFGAPGTIHIGASILIFGYLGFLLLRGFFERNAPSIILSMIVFFLYGGALWGVLPGTPGVSWQGHLFGFVGGAIASRIVAYR